MLAEYLIKLQKREPLSFDEAKTLLDLMLSESTAPEQVAACIALMHLNNFCSADIIHFEKAMRAHMKTMKISGDVLDIVGTGGDGRNTINISTGAGLLLAACGVSVAKNGNRAVSSLSGAADVLEALGICIDIEVDTIKNCIETHQFGFCFAPIFHPAFLRLRKVRKLLGIPSIFNILGPLLNPVSISYRLLGVYDPALLNVYAEVMMALPIKKALIFHTEGLDELTTHAPATAVYIENNSMKRMTIDARDYGLRVCHLNELKGGDANENAALLLEVFQGEENAIADTLALNAGVGLHLAGKVENIGSGVELAKATLKSGKLLALLEKLRQTSCMKS